MKDKFLLNPGITYLNHGSFGACPKDVFEKYQQYQLMLEQEPVQFITKTGPALLENSKQVLANYINCDSDDLVYVTNPSTAYNIVIKNLKLSAGDEILTTNHEYGAMDRTWNYYCERSGAKYVRQEVKLPLKDTQDFIDQFWSGLTPKTKIIFISQITSSTGLIFPVKEICERAKELGLLTIVDGAHVPAHIPLNLKDLNADIYTGACHKWMLAPKGSSFLYVKKELQALFDPLIISWGYDAEFPGKSKFLDYHTYQGTRDFSAFLATKDAIQFLNENNWTEKSEACKKMNLDVYPEACRRLNTNPISPVNTEFLGQLCSIPIRTREILKLKDLLYEKYRIEIPLTTMQEQQFMRISFQAYVSMSDIETLFDAISDIQKTTSLLE